jgi:N-acetylmuramoyl-L-alanine amidase CwlA
MKIIQNLVPESKYSIKCPYSMKPTRIVVHNTANDASAKNEIAYMIRNNYETSFHYAVDDKEIVQGLPENRNGWHASDGGKGKGNREGIAIEICYSKSGGDKFIKAEQNAVELIVDILKRYGWGVDKVTKHQDYTNKYCPHRTLDMGWDRFIKMIDAKLNPKTVETPTSIKKGDKVKVNKGAKDYNGKSISSFVYNNTYTVDELKGDRAVLDKKGICTAFNVKDLTLVTASAVKAEAQKPAPATIKVGSTVKLNKGAKTYTGGKLASFVYNRKHKVKQINGDRVVITYLGIVIAAVNIKDLTLA